MYECNATFAIIHTKHDIFICFSRQTVYNPRIYPDNPYPLCSSRGCGNFDYCGNVTEEQTNANISIQFILFQYRTISANCDVINWCVDCRRSFGTCGFNECFSCGCWRGNDGCNRRVFSCIHDNSNTLDIGKYWVLCIESAYDYENACWTINIWFTPVFTIIFVMIVSAMENYWLHLAIRLYFMKEIHRWIAFVFIRFNDLIIESLGICFDLEYTSKFQLNCANESISAKN